MISIMVIALLIMLGLAFGSFAEALVWRLHQQSLPKRQRVASDKELSMLTGRSMCPSCKHKLFAADLIPLLSWLYLKGRCRYCHVPIGWHSPLLELATAALFVVSYHWWPFGFENGGMLSFAVWLVALVGFVALVLYDLRWMLLPDKIVFPLLALAFVNVLVGATIFGGGVDAIVNAGLGVIVSGGLFFVLYLVSRGRWIGFGDVKLGFVIGLLLGDPTTALFGLFTASLLGTLFSLPGLLSRRLSRTSKLPFGPFLITGAIIAMLFGRSIIDLYDQWMVSLI